MRRCPRCGRTLPESDFYRMGNRYLAFWKRCKERERGLLAAYPRPCRSVITDTYTGEEKVW